MMYSWSTLYVHVWYHYHRKSSEPDISLEAFSNVYIRHSVIDMNEFFISIRVVLTLGNPHINAYCTNIRPPSV